MRPLLPTGTEAMKQEEQPRSATALEPVIQQPRARGHGCGKQRVLCLAEDKFWRD